MKNTHHYQKVISVFRKYIHSILHWMNWKLILSSKWKIWIWEISATHGHVCHNARCVRIDLLLWTVVFVLLFELHSAILKPDFYLYIYYSLNLNTNYSITCRSDNCNKCAISIRRFRDKYLFRWNSFSNSNTWLRV